MIQVIVFAEVGTDDSINLICWKRMAFTTVIARDLELSEIIRHCHASVSVLQKAKTKEMYQLRRVFSFENRRLLHRSSLYRTAPDFFLADKSHRLPYLQSTGEFGLWCVLFFKKFGIFSFLSSPTGHLWFDGPFTKRRVK